ncbi:MAG TPA: nitroreductase family protein [Acidimicrobiia bacterium]|nr:nitroreductase family protein [Acidimicrobiia bacterium]
MMLNTSEETYESVLKLRTVRRFLAKPVTENDLTRILEAARWTGSSKNRQSWSFVVVRERAQLDRLAECGDFTVPIRNAPLVIAPVRLPEGYEWDMGRVSQNIMLAAAAIGVGSCPITLHREDCAREALGIPGDHGCRYVVALGYPDEPAERAGRTASAMAGRKSLEDLVRYERFS